MMTMMTEPQVFYRPRTAAVLVLLLMAAGCGTYNQTERQTADHEDWLVVKERSESEWVYHDPAGDGRLVYRKTAAGDRIMDFSHAGYMGGGVALPDVPTRRIVEPSGDGDDTVAIQTAIDEVSAMPLIDGFRGAVQLAPGIFTVSEMITISTNGVVLRGCGSGRDNDFDHVSGELLSSEYCPGSSREGQTKTTLRMTGEPHLAIAIRGSGDWASDSEEEFTSTKTKIADAYVPSGTASFTVVDATGFTPGDVISIRKPVTESWVEFMEMHDLVRNGDSQTWLPTGSTIDTERRIAGVSGNTVTLEVPLPDSYDSKFLNPPGTTIVNIPPPTRISQSGVEHLHIQAPSMAISHTQPHFQALRLNGEDLWARDLLIEETMNSVGIGGQRITVKKVHIRRDARSQGASRPAKFAPNGSQVLLDRCSVEADNVWFIATGARVPGPIVILNADFRGDSRVESHQRWATGMLYDNVHAPDGGIEFRNRGSMGSGHGWSMGWGVSWNSVADYYIIQNPPGAPNWMIGNIGEIRSLPRPFEGETILSDGIQDSHGKPVTPRSLYLAQLAERLGPEVLEIIGY